MSGQALAIRQEDPFELGKVFAESGMFPNVRKASEAIVKIIAGREFGLGPLAAMNGIHMIDGKPSLAANLIAGQIKRHPLYNYKVIAREDERCELEFFERDAANLPYESVGRITWEKKDATKAGLLGKKNWRSYPRDMYFARCLTSGARTYCPDVLGGSPIYTPEELGYDAEAEAVEIEPAPEVLTPTSVEQPTAAPEPEVPAEPEHPSPAGVKALLQLATDAGHGAPIKDGGDPWVTFRMIIALTLASPEGPIEEVIAKMTRPQFDNAVEMLADEMKENAAAKAAESQ